MLTITSDRYLGTIQDSNRNQQTPNDTNRWSQAPQRLFKDAWRFLLTLNGICWCLVVSDGGFYCSMVSGNVRWALRSFSKGI